MLRCSCTVPRLHLLGVRGLARPRMSYQGAGPDEASSRRSLFATEQPWTAGWPRPRGWALRYTSHRIASRRTAQHRILPQCAPRASTAALRARVLYEYIHETDSRHDGRRTLTCSEHGTVDHSTSGLALSASPARLPAQHTHTYSQPALVPILSPFLVGPPHKSGRLTGETRMWREITLREDGAFGSVDAGPARPGLLIALIPASLGCP